MGKETSLNQSGGNQAGVASFWQGLPGTAKFLVVMAAFVIVVAGMKASEEILVPFLMAVFISTISAPGLFWLQKKGVPTILAISIVAVILLGAGLLVGTLLARTVQSFTASLPEYGRNLQQMSETLYGWLESKGVEISDKPLQQYINPQSGVKLMGELLGQLGQILTDGFLIFLTMIFILLEASIFPAKLKAILKRPEESLKNLNKIASDVKRYLGIKTGLSLVTGILITCWLEILGVDYAVLWGLIAFLLNFVPNIGSFIAAIPAVLLALVQLNPKYAILVALGYVVVNIVIGNFIEPRLMGQRLGLSTLVVFLSLVFWGWVLGPLGMLLSVPLTMTVKIILQSHGDTRWIATLLGSEIPKELKERSA